MSKLHRVMNIITGLLMIFFGLLFFLDPAGGLSVLASVLGLTFTLRGLQSLLFYFTMAKNMVGGRSALYRGIIWLDVGLLTGSLADSPAFYIIIYIAALHIFSGAVDILRAREARGVGAPSWKASAINGSTDILLAAAVIAGGAVMHSAKIAVYVYAAGLIYSAAVRIATAFRRTAIVYIQ